LNFHSSIVPSWKKTSIKVGWDNDFFHSSSSQDQLSMSFLDFRCKQHPCWISRNAKENNKNTQKYLSACKKQTIFTDSQGMYLALWPTQALLCRCLHIPCLQPLKPNEKQREHSVQDFLQNEN
jgi:hypothetical protein